MEVCEKKMIAVLVPCYNEAATVEKVVRDFRAALPTAEIYVYDNNSTDGTAVLAEKAGAIVGFEKRQGKGYVIKTMLREIDADCYLMVDGDDTYPAAEASAMVTPVLSGNADMVVGDRLSTTYAAENKRPFHNLGNNLVCGIISFFYHTRISDTMTGYRALSRDFAKELPSVLSGGFQIETEMTVCALEKKKRVISIPVSYQDRPAGSVSKLHTYSDGAKILWRLFTMIFHYHPARILIPAAVVFCILLVIILLICL